MVLSNGSGFGKTFIMFGANMSSLIHINIKQKGILTLGKSPTDGLDGTTLTVEKEFLLSNRRNFV